jgi:double-stranded uracil-DNA glycosylase
VSITAWLRNEAHSTRQWASQRVLAGRALADQLPATRAAWVAGALTFEQVGIIRRASQRVLAAPDITGTNLPSPPTADNDSPSPKSPSTKGHRSARMLTTVRSMGFTRAELESFRDATLPDLLGPQTRLLFVGINPGLWTAATQAHFSRRGNRFYPALLAAGIIDRPIDASAGYTEVDREYLLERGIGITNLVARATARADELTHDELIAGGRRLQTHVAELGVPVVAVLGITAYRTAYALPRATAGRQPESLCGAELWVVPNPSGLNAHSSLAALAMAYREVAIAAGLDLSTN